MRGIVYRLRGRAGSILVGLAVAAAFGCAASGAAAAKRPAQVKPPANRPAPVAHAAGHKIA